MENGIFLEQWSLDLALSRAFTFRPWFNGKFSNEISMQFLEQKEIISILENIEIMIAIYEIDFNSFYEVNG